MAGIPERDLEETRAALAPTLEATAAVLPWLAKPKAARFPASLNQRWNDGWKQLAVAWAERHDHGPAAIRPAIFVLYAVALESAETDCLRLGEALASAADHLEGASPSAQLNAALSACIECFNETAGLEHPLLADRARHFAQRLETTLANTGEYAPRSAVLDRLFIDDAEERLERMREALAALPPDAYALKLDNAEMAQQAEQLDLWGIVHLCRRFDQLIPTEQRIGELDSAELRQAMLGLLQQIATAVAGIST